MLGMKSTTWATHGVINRKKTHKYSKGSTCVLVSTHSEVSASWKITSQSGPFICSPANEKAWLRGYLKGWLMMCKYIIDHRQSSQPFWKGKNWYAMLAIHPRSKWKWGKSCKGLYIRAVLTTTLTLRSWQDFLADILLQPIPSWAWSDFWKKHGRSGRKPIPGFVLLQL